MISQLMFFTIWMLGCVFCFCIYKAFVNSRLYAIMQEAELRPMEEMEQEIRYVRKEIKKQSKEIPIKFPDKLGIKKDKTGYYIKKGKYLTEKEIRKIYNNYIKPLKKRTVEYPTRIIQL